MSQQSYKTLTVYQDAKQLVLKVYQLLKLFPLEERFALCDQIRRAVISVPSNIVEGMSRTSNKEKVHFLDIAYASMLEMDSQLDISKDLGFISEEQYKNIHNIKYNPNYSIFFVFFYFSNTHFYTSFQV